MLRIAVCLLLTTTVAAAGAPGNSATSNNADEARAHYKKGLSYYALQKYAEAANEYEAAFELEPDPALLYNAAQAHRLASNKTRALALYQSYLRLFPGQTNRNDVQRHIAALKTAIESDAKSRSNTPTDPIGPTTNNLPEPKPEPPKPEPQPQPQVIVAPPPSQPARKIKPWVWGILAGGVVVLGVGLGVGLGLGLSRTRYPDPSIGTVRPQ